MISTDISYRKKLNDHTTEEFPMYDFPIRSHNHSIIQRNTRTKPRMQIHPTPNAHTEIWSADEEERPSPSC